MAHRKSLIQVKFRFRENLLRRLEREAKRNDRSTNAEIAHRLEQSLQKEDEAAYMSRIASMAADKFSADVVEKLNVKAVEEWLAKRLAAAASTDQMASLLVQELTEQVQKPPTTAPVPKPPTTAPERQEHRKEGN
jgi:hypothetical protein